MTCIRGHSRAHRIYPVMFRCARQGFFILPAAPFSGCRLIAKLIVRYKAFGLIGAGLRERFCPVFVRACFSRAWGFRTKCVSGAASFSQAGFTALL